MARLEVEISLVRESSFDDSDKSVLMTQLEAAIRAFLENTGTFDLRMSDVTHRSGKL